MVRKKDKRDDQESRTPVIPHGSVDFFTAAQELRGGLLQMRPHLLLLAKGVGRGAFHLGSWGKEEPADIRVKQVGHL